MDWWAWWVYCSFTVRFWFELYIFRSYLLIFCVVFINSYCTNSSYQEHIVEIMILRKVCKLLLFIITFKCVLVFIKKNSHKESEFHVHSDSKLSECLCIFCRIFYYLLELLKIQQLFVIKFSAAYCYKGSVFTFCRISWPFKNWMCQSF